MAYLITKTDIKTYRPTAELDDARINPFIIEAQNMDLRPVLNDVLFYDFITKFNVTLDPMYAKYQKLLNGGTYTYNSQTIYFDGVKAMLSYYALARFVVANPVNVTRMGVAIKTLQQSEPADAATIKYFVNDLRGTAIGYQNQIIQFLITNPTDYPLYNLGGGASQQPNKTSFKFFKL